MSALPVKWEPGSCFHSLNVIIVWVANNVWIINCVQLLLIFVYIFSLGVRRIISENTKQLLRDNERIDWSYDYFDDEDDDYFW